MNLREKLARALGIGETDVDKRRLNCLAWLVFAWLLSMIIFPEVSPFLLRSSRYEVWFWTANGILAIEVCVGILLAFWWACYAAAARRSFFFFFCLFMMFLGVNTLRGVAISFATTELMSEFSANRNSCEAEVHMCSKFVANTDPDIRQRVATMFYGSTGINLLGTQTEGNIAKPPSEKAAAFWQQRQSMESEIRETNRILKDATSGSGDVLMLNIFVAAGVFGIGGWWLGRPRRKPP